MNDELARPQRHARPALSAQRAGHRGQQARSGELAQRGGEHRTGHTHAVSQPQNRIHRPGARRFEFGQHQRARRFERDRFGQFLRFGLDQRFVHFAERQCGRGAFIGRGASLQESARAGVHAWPFSAAILAA